MPGRNYSVQNSSVVEMYRTGTSGTRGLSHLASASYSQLLTQRTLRSLKVRDVMRTRFDTVPANASVEDFVENYLLRSTQLLWPVAAEGRVVGLVS